ncbi:hypothetical protein MMC21_006419 [Puttea exsequens]|nr:hypothetical protein [Puttea exsequens]
MSLITDDLVVIEQLGERARNKRRGTTRMRQFNRGPQEDDRGPQDAPVSQVDQALSSIGRSDIIPFKSETSLLTAYGSFPGIGAQKLASIQRAPGVSTIVSNATQASQMDPGVYSGTADPLADEPMERQDYAIAYTGSAYYGAPDLFSISPRNT